MRRVFWLVLSAVLLSVSYMVTVSGMIGEWDIHVLGITHGAVWDPGGSYLASALLLFDHKVAVFIGHPGLTLMLVCHAIAKAMWLVSWTDDSFQHYAGKNIYWVTLWAMVGMTGLVLIAAYVVERFAARLLEDERLAMLAALAFVTSYPVLYYLNRISPEPLLVICTLLAFLWLWSYYERGESPAAFAYLGLSAQAAVAALFTKFLIVGPIVVFIPVQILCRRGVRRSIAIRDAVLFVLFTLPGLWLGSIKTDWPRFFRFWFEYTPGTPTYVSSNGWVANVAGNLIRTVWFMLLGSARHLFSSEMLWPTLTTREGLFFASEDLFLIVAVAGLIMYWRACRNRPALLAWFFAFLAMISIPYLQRGLSAWHYVHVQIAVAAVFFSYGLGRIVRASTGLTPSSARGWLLCVGVTIAVHGLAIALFVDLQRYNASRYVAWEWYYKAPATVGDGSRIGLVNTLAMPEIMAPISTYAPNEGFSETFAGSFVPVRDDASDDDLRRRHIAAIVTLDHGRLSMRRLLPR